MTIKKCDRCGQEIDESLKYFKLSHFHSVKYEEVDDYNVVGFIANALQKALYADSSEEIYRNYDLCPECAESFERWLSNEAD